MSEHDSNTEKGDQHEQGPHDFSDLQRQYQLSDTEFPISLREIGSEDPQVVADYFKAKYQST